MTDALEAPWRESHGSRRNSSVPTGSPAGGHRAPPSAHCVGRGLRQAHRLLVASDDLLVVGQPPHLRGHLPPDTHLIDGAEQGCPLLRSTLPYPTYGGARVVATHREHSLRIPGVNHRGDCERGNEKHGQGLQGKHRGPAEFRADWEHRSVYHTALHPPFQPDLAAHGFTDTDTVQGRATCGIRQP